MCEVALRLYFEGRVSIKLVGKGDLWNHSPIFLARNRTVDFNSSTSLRSWSIDSFDSGLKYQEQGILISLALLGRSHILP